MRLTNGYKTSSEVWRSDATAVVEKLHKQLYAQQAESFARIRASIQKFTPSGSQTMPKREFERMLGGAGLFLTSQEQNALLRTLTGSTEITDVPVTAFMSALRVPLSPERFSLVSHLWESFGCEDSIPRGDFVARFVPTRHPRQRSGELSPEEVMRRFEASLDELGCQTDVSKDDFFGFFQELSACTPVEKEAVFENVVVSCFGLERKFTEVTATRLHKIMVQTYDKLRMLAPPLRAEVILPTRKHFYHKDSDERGSLDLQQFGDFLTGIGVRLPFHELRALFLAFAGEERGRVEFNAFHTILRELNAAPHRVRLTGSGRLALATGIGAGGGAGQSGAVPSSVFEKIRHHLLERSANGFGALSSSVRNADKGRKGYASPSEFRWVIREMGVTSLGEADIDRLISTFDVTQDGRVRIWDFKAAVRGDASLAPVREQALYDVWTALTGDPSAESVPISAVADVYDPSLLPKVKNQSWTHEQAVKDLLGFLGEETAIGEVNRASLFDFILDQSAAIPQDAHFLAYIERAFRLAGGAANN
uniref:EF-hand domain-containing protein n=1 Tax=Chromera velia CCMP2878 TaxID=1169474 RepID=A0A0G4HRC7_9ALVE|eukprot:Cvel_8079.t1-p1 / transcript=Cvel_8079.t1 / gene=Cvel_8079 / organism=Chromera_velia_CCMP2878 / gene_product=Calcyphosin, putative / transcript_product=Calcyphosin, putative / location=Cvel_scaffold438:22364-25907(-) / protein_length=535 / sequence_SO=supercontig / SO=protein_coding / is_pseudo=false